ncbi:MAG: transcription termination/antitermination NusG family protein [Pseudomonadota bacterium]
MSFWECQEALPSQPDASGQPWHVAYTRPRQEQTALVNLERQGFEAYLPLFKSCRNTADGLQAHYEPMFPRYLFMRAAHARQSLASVASTRGAVGLVRFGGCPAEIDERTVHGIRTLESQRNQASLDALCPIRPGVRVRMRSGALQGIEGLVVSVARQRVTFLLDMLGRRKEVTVERGELVAA